MARQTKTPFALLGILSMGSASGYDIKKIMEQTTDHFWREGDSSIYPILKQLLDQNLVSCESINTESGKPKKIYTITADGQQELNEWLKIDPEELQIKNELLLKVFFGGNVDPVIIIDHIKRRQHSIKVKLDKYKTIAKPIIADQLSGSKLFSFLTLKAGIFQAEAALRWCDDALRILKNEK